MAPTPSAWSAAMVAGVSVLGLAFAQGGYFATAWGWATLGFLWVAAVALVMRRTIRLGLLDGVFLAGLAGLTAWTLLSSAWSLSPSESVLEAERALVYVACAAAVLLVVEPRSVSWLLGALVVAIAVVCGYGLVTRLFPAIGVLSGPLGSYRLAAPLGYWNALGLLAVMGVVLAVGFAATATSRAARAVAGALPVALMTTLYFTFGRAAWLALAAGLAAMLVVARGRRCGIVAAALLAVPWIGVAVALAAHSSALTAAGAPMGKIAGQGHRLAAAVAALCVLAALATLAQPRVAAAVETLAPRRVRPVIVGVGLSGALVAAALVLVAAGGAPGRLLNQAEHSFSSPPAPVEGQLNRRLFSLSGEGRAAVWRVAWDTAWSHPLVGTGAGSFEQRWLAARPRPEGFRDAHNLYLETLAELGAVGLMLLGVVFGAPARAAWRARSDSLVPVAAGGLVAYLTHAALDWDWEMPAITVAGLVCAAAILAAARPENMRALRWPARVAGVTAATVLAGLALVGLVSNGAVGASIAALRDGDAAAAERQAAKAARWAPWSAEPLRWEGEAQLAEGEDDAARQSFRSAVRLEPRNWALWYGLALASHGSARGRALARAAALNPLSPEVRTLTQR